jgi:primosomal protein N'
MSIAPLVKKVLAASGQPLTAGRIVSELVAQGFKKVTTTEVNSYLYMAQNNGTVCKVEIEGLKAPGWKLSESSRQQMGLSPRPTPEPKLQDSAPALSLYRWQQEALGVWERHRHRGMVEAVTGSGKTRLAFAAWDRLRQKVKPLNALVVVPTIPLMNQCIRPGKDAYSGGRRGD